MNTVKIASQNVTVGQTTVESPASVSDVTTQGPGEGWLTDESNSEILLDDNAKSGHENSGTAPTIIADRPIRALLKSLFGGFAILIGVYFALMLILGIASGLMDVPPPHVDNSGMSSLVHDITGWQIGDSE